MRYFFIIPVFMFPFFMTFAYAEGNKESRGNMTEHTQHPPHDHHDTDHIKKIDEALRNKRKKAGRR